MIDFRKLNSILEGDTYSIADLNGILDQLGDAFYLSTLDLFSAHHQVELTEESKKYTAFSCSAGSFQYRKVPMGISSVPACFTRLIDKVIAGLQGVFAYLDDIIIYATDL